MAGHRDPIVPLVNLGSGENPSPVGLNIDGSLSYRLRALGVARYLPAFLVGSADRLARLRGETTGLLFHDLRRGLPLADASVAAVFHQHLLEHLDRRHAPALMAEIHRVLAPGGIHRICVPDLHGKMERYHLSYRLAREGRITPAQHERTIVSLYEQSVRRASASSRRASRLRRAMENLLLGDARRRGETHQWMYDEVNLTGLLQAAGFADIRRLEPGESAIDGWAGFGLELDREGREVRPGSLYIEARKPGPPVA